MNSKIKKAAKVKEELSQPNAKSDSKQDGIQHTRARLGESLKKGKNKVMHGQYVRNTDRQLISEEDMFIWLSKGDLKAETPLNKLQKNTRKKMKNEEQKKKCE